MDKTKNTCYNLTMPKTKIKMKNIIVVAVIISLLSGISSCLLIRGTSATSCTASPCNTTFQVDVKEVLSVSITSPTSGYDEGNVGELLTGQINVSITSNNAGGFATGIRASNAAATLTGDNGGALANLSSSVSGSNFPAGKWGYSLESATPESKNYSPLSAYNTTPTKIDSISSSSAGTKSGSVYFAAKASYDNPAGTYTGTVNISVVSGSTSPDPGVNPVGPDAGSTPTYHDAQGVTTYTTTTESSDNKTTTTEVSNGDNRISYADPLGESKRTESNIKNGSMLPVVLATTSAISAATGLGFFIIAKRRENDEDELE